MTRPFRADDHISHFNIFDHHAKCVISLLKSHLRAGYLVGFQVCLTTIFWRNQIFLGCYFAIHPFLQHCFSTGPVYQFNVIPVGNSVDNSDDFAHPFADAQHAASRHPHRGWLRLFGLFSDNAARPMKTVNAYVEPIFKDAIGQASRKEYKQSLSPLTRARFWNASLTL